MKFTKAGQRGRSEEEGRSDNDAKGAVVRAELKSERIRDLLSSPISVFFKLAKLCLF